jgi:hypothetical protein
MACKGSGVQVPLTPPSSFVKDGLNRKIRPVGPYLLLNSKSLIDRMKILHVLLDHCLNDVWI